MSLEKIVFRDTEVFKGLRFLTDKIRDKQTHFKPTETFQFTHFSSGHPISVKKGFVKGEALRLLKTKLTSLNSPLRTNGGAKKSKPSASSSS